MGQKNTKNIDTINWNDVKTEDMSPNNKFYDINQDAQELIKRLNFENKNSNKDSIIDFNNSNDIFKKNYNNISKNYTTTEYSKTSPFISPEMYKYLIEKSSESKSSEVSEVSDLSDIDLNNNLIGGNPADTSSTSDENSNVNLQQATSSSLNNNSEINLKTTEETDQCEDEDEDYYVNKRSGQKPVEKPVKKPVEKQVETQVKKPLKKSGDNKENKSKPVKKKVMNPNAPSNGDDALKRTFTVENRLKIAEQEARRLEENQDEAEISDIDESQELSSQANTTILQDGVDRELRGGAVVYEYSYTSSSAHTANESDSNVETTISNHNNRLLSDSVNTSDINMVSVE